MSVSLAGVLLAFLTGCSRKSSDKPIAAEQVPQVLNEAFKDAKPEAGAAANEMLASIQSGDPDALVHAHKLPARGDLTDEQKSAANRAVAALHKRMVEDAARGDQNAQEALEVYRASK